MPVADLAHGCPLFLEQAVNCSHSLTVIRKIIPRAGWLDLRFRWGKLASLLLVLKSGRLVRAIAKGFVRRVPATAEGDGGASREAVRLALHIHQLDFPFDAQWAIISNDYLG
jgi:hypothetical protein